MNNIVLSIKSLLYRLTQKHVVNEVRKTKKELMFIASADSLTDKTLNSISSGITDERLCGEHDVIVSLTSYRERLYEVYLAIESIMQGSVKPNRIILWLEDELKDKELPITLKKQLKRGLEIKYCKDLKSYNKMIPAMRTFPDACIITIDDDVIYKYDVVEKLVSSYIKEPHYIHANRIHRIILGTDGKPISYMDWNSCSNNMEASHLNFLTGVGGVIYPPRCLSQEVFNESVFMDICKTSDDVWMNAMALFNGTKVKKVYTHDPNGEDYIDNFKVQDKALFKINNNKKGQCMNDVQIMAVFSKYHLFEKLKG